MTKTKEMHMLDQKLLKSHFYSTFVLHQTTEQNDMIHAIEVEVIHKIIITTKITIHKTYIALHLEIDLVMTRVLLLHNTLDHDMTFIKEIRDPIALLTDRLTDPLIDMTLVTDIDHARIQEITTVLQNTHLLLDHLHDQEILDLLDPVHIRIQQTSLIQYNHKPKMIQLILKYTCMHHPTEMANAVTPTSWFYSLYTHTPSKQIQRDYLSRLEISFLLDSGASISVLSYPTHVTIAKLLNIK